MSTSTLLNKRIVVTRPHHQNEKIAKMISDQGGIPLLFPVLEILEPENQTALLAQLKQIDNYDIAIFISPNAVNKSLNLLFQTRQWPTSILTVAIGKSSAKELKRFGIQANIAPHRKFNSETLLEHPDLQKVSGKKIIIFRGDGGRELLGDTLKSRGASISYANAYRRHKPRTNTEELFYHWSRNEIDAIMLTSSESLRNFYDMIGKLGSMWLRKTTLVLGSEHIADTVVELGIKSQPIIADNPSDEFMFRALKKHFEQTTP